MKRKINTEEISRSHIHDAINLFNLVISEISELNVDDTNQTQIRKIKKLIESSVDHFKEVFETLDSKNTEIYLKSSMDLKDLLDLEIFDVFRDSRLTIEDKVKQNNALIIGNFPLLSKALLNLIENALKVSNSIIELKLEEGNEHWLIKIHTPDEAFNEELASSFEKLKPINSRHGLKSISEILKYHDAKVEVYNLYTSENSISIYFPKLRKTVSEQSSDQRIFPVINKTFPAINKTLLEILMASFIVIFSVTAIHLERKQSYSKLMQKLTNYENKNLGYKAKELQNKITSIEIAIKNDQDSYLENIYSVKLPGNTVENQYIIFKSFLQMNSLSTNQIKSIEKQASNFYEYHFINASNLEAQSKTILASKEKLLGLLIKLKNSIYISIEEKIIRNENIETISKLILYLQDQEP